ncbi:hypothetical protein P261_02777 [Lachnospiraceae bacterium TWA4]|nr:hypothetical protein P261_02777 [Lachnospiraceae bacterium TWA4]
MKKLSLKMEKERKIILEKLTEYMEGEEWSRALVYEALEDEWYKQNSEIKKLSPDDYLLIIQYDEGKLYFCFSIDREDDMITGVSSVDEVLKVIY